MERSFQLSGKFNFSGWWSDRSHLSPVQRLGEFIDEVLLVEILQNIVIFIDEIDSVLSLKFPTDDFFALIRNFYNQRADHLKYRRITFTLLGVATPSDFVQDKKRTPFNIGKGIELKGFQLEEAKPLAKGLAGKSKNPKEALQQILQWTGGQPFLTQKVCQLIQTDNQGLSVDELVQSRIIENWETKDEQAHLRTIRDRIWRNEQRIGRLLGLYQQILQQGEIATDNSAEQIDLRLTGLVVQQMGKLRVYNRVYQSVFTLDWVKKELAKLRPYAEAFSNWEASGYQEESYLLRGQALQDALEWSKNKGLSDLDDRFLRESQTFDRREAERANKVLEKAQNKAGRIIRGGFVGLFVVCVVAAGIGLWATYTNKLAEQEHQQAEQARQQAEQARQQAEQDRQRAQQARQQAEQEAETAEQKRQQAEQDAAKAKKTAESGRYSTNAEKAFRRDDLESAISDAKQAAILDPNNSWKFFQLAGYQILQGDRYDSNNNFQSAIQSYQNAQENLRTGRQLPTATLNEGWVQHMESEVNSKLQRLQPPLAPNQANP